MWNPATREARSQSRSRRVTCSYLSARRSPTIASMSARCAHLLRQQDFACLIQHAIKARPVAQIQADGQFRSSLLSVCCIIVMVSFFIAGLLSPALQARR